MSPPIPKVRIVKRLDITVVSANCPNKPPDCGLFHDNMSLMWVRFKDLVDELLDAKNAITLTSELYAEKFTVSAEY